jgi:repressor LexA
MVVLTSRQEKILQFIESFCASQGFSPTLREIAAHFRFKSANAVQDHVTALRRKGYIEVASNKKQRNLLSRRMGRSLFGQSRGIPILGKIAAGNPIAAIENADEFLTLDVLGLANGENNLFALIVKGDSMINRGIKNGDTVIIRRQKIVTKKDVAAVRVGNDVTLKYVVQEANCIRLVPDNDAMQPIIVKPDEDIEVMGKVVKLIRDAV